LSSSFIYGHFWYKIVGWQVGGEQGSRLMLCGIFLSGLRNAMQQIPVYDSYVAV